MAPTAVTFGTPLVSAEGGCEALACLMTDIGRAARRGACLVTMEWVGYNNPIAQLLRKVAVETNNSVFVEFDVWERGFRLRHRDRRSICGPVCR